MTYALSPVMKNLDGMRIVLTSGRTPRDLDSHLSYPGNHIYFEHKVGRDANLNVDDMDSYGPETITINRKQLGESYVYSAQDYINLHLPNSPALSASEAKVLVYLGQPESHRPGKRQPPAPALTTISPESMRMLASTAMP